MHDLRILVQMEDIQPGQIVPHHIKTYIIWNGFQVLKHKKLDSFKEVRISVGIR